MWANVLSRPGESFTLEQLPDPEPKADEVLLRVAGCGVCHSDLHVMKADVPFPMPCVLGHEVSGTVVAVGSAVRHVAEGARVATSFIMPCGDCAFCWSGREELCSRFFEFNRRNGYLYDGTSRLNRTDGTAVRMYSMAGLAEFAVVPASAVFPIPDELPLADAAILGCAMLTAYGAVAHVGEVRPGQSVAVVAVGGVGAAIVQLARVFGASQIIAIDVNDRQLSSVTRNGATHTVNSAQHDAAKVVSDITGGRGADIAFEALGSPATFEMCLELLTDGGRAVPVGIAPRDMTASVPLQQLTRRKLQILGSYGGRPRSDMPVLIELAAANAIDLSSAITQRFTLAQAADAYGLLASGDIVGRAVIEMDGSR